MVTEGSFEVVKMTINLDFEDYTGYCENVDFICLELDLEDYTGDCEDVTIVANCEVEEHVDCICLDTGHMEASLEVCIDGLFVDGVSFSLENLAMCYGQSVADKIVNDIEYKAGNVYYS